MKLLRKNLPSHISVLIHSSSGAPAAVRVNLRKVGLWAAATSVVFLTMFVGTLLFFREVELNRKLSDHVLELELTRRLWRDAAVAINARPPAPDTSKSPVKDAMAPKPLVMAPPSPASPDLMARDVSAVSEPVVERPSVSMDVRARLADLNVDCTAVLCGVHMGLVPTAPGTARGHLVVVLETEVPRIGSANVGGSVRKRFFVYPGNISRDDITTEEINRLDGKPFKFSHALQTTVDFNLANLLRPLAVNVYLFDASKTLIHHERKPIENGE